MLTWCTYIGIDNVADGVEQEFSVLRAQLGFLDKGAAPLI